MIDLQKIGLRRKRREILDYSRSTSTFNYSNRFTSNLKLYLIYEFLFSQTIILIDENSRRIGSNACSNRIDYKTYIATLSLLFVASFCISSAAKDNDEQNLLFGLAMAGPHQPTRKY